MGHGAEVEGRVPVELQLDGFFPPHDVYLNWRQGRPEEERPQLFDSATDDRVRVNGDHAVANDNSSFFGGACIRERFDQETT